MKSLTLSIVIPAYNEEHHLKACLDSIRSQTVRPDEVLVIDNNSEDSTVKIAKSYPFVTVLSEKKQGVLYARDTGFNAAASDIIGRIDADTQLDKNWVAQVKKTLSDSEVAAVTGPVYFHDMPFSPWNYRADHFFKGPLYKYDKQFPFLFGTSMAISKDAWLKIRSKVCHDKTVHEDMDLAIHLFQNDMKIAYDVHLRAGMSARRYDDRPKDFYRYISMQRKTYAKHNLYPVGPKVATAAYSLGYVTLWPLRRSYDPKTGKRSLKQLVRGHKARKNPMD